MKRLVAGVFLPVVLLTSGCGDLDEGIAAMQRRDYRTALKELRPLARRGDPEAQRHLGIMYARGFGVERDAAAAATWFRKAAEQGHAQAQVNLGRFLEKGPEGTRDSAEAAEWYRKAAEQGIPEAQFRLGRLYQTGEGVPPDLMSAYRWFSRAADRGDPRAARARDEVAGRMGAEMLAEAERLMAEGSPQ